MGTDGTMDKVDMKTWKTILWLRFENRAGWRELKLFFSLGISLFYLNCDKYPGHSNGNTCSTENVTEVEIGCSEENTKKNRKRSKEPS